ncbi:TPA: hypothetical protein PTV74_003306 [Clostridium botulinum]|nr:hypothetical protein [Clostridium botulinum]HDK7206461.1 hypothetical protein [Clostridium botulinum]HDK7210196.1 hypothetical protein [Clostridium botulinum]HDK7265646.1 hypothetical protein [Clostridium botulinum]HDK7269493.1 hypothetical protein [Clostridium botulinum]
MEIYNIDFEKAKSMNIYKHSKYVNNIKEYFNKYKKEDKEIIADLEFGNIAIELNVDNIDGVKSLDYYVCARCSEDYNRDGVWYGGDDKILYKVNLDNLEEDMFNCLMKYAKENNLKWSKLN